ncbi:PREDICTED: beta-1,3-glucan-binding protein-like [Papilio polytes]|uniref:beta-1,3-glucan-binding protein-like n=1 Tax=Papilio polytes TaxID=76194 RepID=UPI0006760BD9|nr:PREDICTED: beta-1,3-glucan-binding protein-like [Papilio polytes]
MLIIKLLLFSACVLPTVISFTVPKPKIEAIYPKGFRVSAPNDGYSFYGFRSNVNKQLDGLEMGQYSKDIPFPENDQWVYQENKPKLKLGDTIYYWTFVLKNGQRNIQQGSWTVTGFVNNNGISVDEDGNPTRVEFVTDSPSIVFDSKFGTPATLKPEVTVTSSCQESQSAVLGKTKICKGDLLFAEEFDKSDIKELTNWDPEVKFPQEPDYPFNVYMTDSLGLDKGILSISPSLLQSKYNEDIINERLDLANTCTGRMGTRECAQVASGFLILPPVITGKLTTKNKFNFRFGRIEIRAKLTEGNWLIPEITLEPRDSVYGDQRYESGLIRVAFAKGNTLFAKKLYGGPVLSDSEPYRTIHMKEKTGIYNWYKDFHNYSMVWKPDGLELFVDGDMYGTVDPGEGFFSSGLKHSVKHAAQWSRGTAMAPLDEMFYVSLGLRVGGVNDFADDSIKPWRNRNSKALLNFWNAKDSWYPTWSDAAVKVDYVRVYAL